MRRAACCALLVMAALSVPVTADRACRYANKYNTEDIMLFEGVRRDFLLDHAKMEARFMKQIGLDQDSQMTYDGQRLDLVSGLPDKHPHLFSAPSKESLHVGVLARTLYDLARNDTKSVAKALYSADEALAVLERKVESFEKFNSEYPGFGGFMPWVGYVPGNATTPTKVTPVANWLNPSRVPALDNGELFWAAYAVAHVLKTYYNTPTLALRWHNVCQRMIDNGPAIFYGGNGTVYTVTVLSNMSLPVSQNNYTGTGKLNDPYEGELFTDMLYLFSNLSQDDKDMLWVQKRGMLQAVNLTVKEPGVDGKVRTITVQRGFWFSAHEQWKYLMLPYYLSDINWRVFLNGERARTWYASTPSDAFNASDAGLQRPSPGMWASVNGPVPTNTSNFPYYSACGIQPIAFEEINYDGTITPYSAFPLFLANPAKAAGWLHNMIRTRKGQNCWGTTESFNVTGETVAPLTTWDSKISTLLAAMGGLATINQEALPQQQLKKLISRLDMEWSREFGWGTLPGEELDFLPPTTTVPFVLPDFTTCDESAPQCA